MKALVSNKLLDIYMDDLGSAKNAAEGAHLASYIYQGFRAKDKCKEIPDLHLYSESTGQQDWNLGELLAKNQNWARTLANTPANHMTPTKFVETVKQNISDKVQVVAHDRSWAEAQKMGSFLSVSKGSSEPPIFLELTYNGSSQNSVDTIPIALVGKGITFDSGGISIKPAAKMDEMR